MRVRRTALLLKRRSSLQLTYGVIPSAEPHTKLHTQSHTHTHTHTQREPT